MTTTLHLQTGVEYYSSLEECKSHVLSKRNSNPRYSTFCQVHFTAGDEQQFEKYRNRYIDGSDDVVADQYLETNYWRKYHTLNGNAVSNTFKYMFNKFKKGIFIQIRNGKVSVMLPFSKHNYTNEWSDRISFPLKYSNMFELFERIYKLDNRIYKQKYVNNHIDQWYANNALFRYEYPLRENDSGVAMVSDMFNELCKRFPNDIPDMEFFVNKRDHPLLRKDECEPYNHIFGENVPLISHNYDTYAPILTMCGGDEYADICIPTWDDWTRISVKEGKYFPKGPQYNSDNTLFNVEWGKRIPTAVFRGGSTGFGLTVDTNMRLKISKMSLECRCDNDIRLLDAGIVSWNVRPRIRKGVVDTFDDDIFKIPLVPFLSTEEQAQYKYIVNIDGHVSAYRLSVELGTGSVVLLVESKYKLWFSDMLDPYIHYVPIAFDLSDLYSQILWCKENDDKCREIAKNAKVFYNTFLQKEGILTYLRDTLMSIKSITGTYHYRKSPLAIIQEEEVALLDSIQYPYLEPLRHIEHIQLPPYGRTFDLLRGIQWFMDKSDDSIFTNAKIVRINKKTTLNIYTFGNVDVMEKKCSLEYERELTNESVMGLYCINPLLKYIPNFSYTFKPRFTEYFKNAPTLFEYIIGDEFNMNTFFIIMIQIALAIHVAQQQCLFIHYDLYPWNIVLKKYDKPIDIYYLVDPTSIRYIQITTDIVPIIIDYGKSRGVVNGQYYGFTKPYYNSTIHDILCILISSMFNMINNRTLTMQELRTVFQLSKFFSGTNYTNGKHFNTTRDLKQFLATHKKYAEMIETPKYELEEKTPLDFVKFVIKCMKPTGNIKYPIHIQWNMRVGTSAHVYNYINSTTDDERIWTVLNLLNKIKNHNISVEDDNSIFVYEIFNRILTSVKNLYPDIDVEDTYRYIRPLQQTIHTTTYQLDIGELHTKSFDENVFDNNVESNILYNYFSNLTELYPDFIGSKQFIIDFIMCKLINGESIVDAVEVYKDIISIDNIKYLQYIANRNTFLNIYKKTTKN